MKRALPYLLIFISALLHGNDWVPYPIEGLTKPVNQVDHIAGHFVAWGGDALYVSPDGSSWTEVELPLNQLVQSDAILGVFHTGAEWVVFASDRNQQAFRLRSNDLQHWEAQTTDISPYAWLFHGKGRFFEVAGTRMRTSTDGFNWQETAIEVDQTGSLTGFGQLEDSLFVFAHNRYWTSADGIQWNEVSSPFLTSQDGRAEGIREIASYSGLTFARTDGQLYRSQDRVQWEALLPLGIHADVLLNTDDPVLQMAKTADALYAVTRSGRVLFTNDGTHWGTTGRSALPASYIWTNSGVAAAGATVVCTDGRDLFRKTAGSGWEQVSNASWAPSHRFEDFAPQFFAGTYFVGGEGCRLWGSEDGIQWTANFKHAGVTDWTGIHNPASFLDATLSLAQGDGTLLAMGYGDWVMLTRDGSMWEHHWTTMDGSPIEAQPDPLGTGIMQALDTPTYEEGRWVSIRADGIPVTSSDGVNWTSELQAPAGLDLIRIVRGNGVFVGQGTAWLHHSSDGMTWTNASVEGLTPGTVNGQFLGLVDFNGGFVVTGNGGQVFRSNDGQNWTRIDVSIEGFAADGTIFKIGDSLYLGATQGSSPYVKMHPDGSFSPVQVLPDPILPVEGDASLQWALNSRSEGVVHINADDLPHSVVEVASLRNNLQEGEGSKATFAVTRHGDLTQALDVRISFVGDASAGQDFRSNLRSSGEDWVLRFDPGFPVLHVCIDPIADSQAESSETVALWIREQAEYRIKPGSQVASVSLIDAP